MRISRALAALALLSLACAGLSAREYYSEKYGYRFDPPEGWLATDGHDGDDRVSVADPDAPAYFQIYAYAGSRYADSAALLADIKKKLRAKGDQDSFDYFGGEACLSGLDFMDPATGRAMKGWGVAIAGAKPADPDIYLMAYCDAEIFEPLADFLSSALDSYRPGPAQRLFPGPVSCFVYDYPAPAKEPRKLPFMEASVGADPKELDASQTLVEQEYRVLACYEESPLWAEAWARFYRRIYFDSYHRLDGLAFQLRSDMERRGLDKKAMAAELLAWIQKFEFTREESSSDFINPLAVAFGGKGDCDSSALLYCILLHHMDIDAILMVSAPLSHAMAGVDLEGAGARFEHAGKEWLVAELTAPVALGLVAEDMSDPADWMGIWFDPFD